MSGKALRKHLARALQTRSDYFLSPLKKQKFGVEVLGSRLRNEKPRYEPMPFCLQSTNSLPPRAACAQLTRAG